MEIILPLGIAKLFLTTSNRFPYFEKYIRGGDLLTLAIKCTCNWWVMHINKMRLQWDLFGEKYKWMITFLIYPLICNNHCLINLLLLCKNIEPSLSKSISICFIYKNSECDYEGKVLNRSYYKAELPCWNTVRLLLFSIA